MKKFLFVTIIVLIMIIPVIFNSANVNVSNEFLNGNNLKEIRNSNINNILATINGENINGWEVAYLKWQYNNYSTGTNSQNANADASNEDIIIRIAKEKLIIQEAKKRGITITAEEINSTRKNLTDSYYKNIDKNKAFIDGLGVSKEEFIEQMVFDEMNKILSIKLMKEVIISISNGSFNCSDQLLNRNVEDFKTYIKQLTEGKNENIKSGSEKIMELYLHYIDSLFKQSQFNIIS